MRAEVGRAAAAALFAWALPAAAPPALAQAAVDADELAAQLNALVEEGSAFLGSAISLTLDGPITVEGVRTGDVVSFPDAVVSLPGLAPIEIAGRTGSIAELDGDLLVLDFAPEAFEYVAAFEIPSIDDEAMTITGVFAGDVTIDLAQSTLAAADYQIDDFTISGGLTGHFTAASVEVGFESEALAEAGRYDMSSQMRMVDVAQSSPLFGEIRQSAEMTQDLNITNLDVDALYRLSGLMGEILGLIAAEGGDLNADLPTTAMADLFTTLFEETDGLFSDAEFRSTSTDSTIMLLPELFLVSSYSEDFATLQGMDQPIASVRYGANGTFEAVQPTEESVELFLPASYELDMSFEAVPRVALFRAIEKMMGAMEDGGVDDHTTKIVLETLLREASTAGSSMVLQTASLTSEDYGFSLTGFGQIDETATFNVIAEATLSVSGMDWLVNTLLESPTLREAGISINVLRGFAERDEATGAHRLAFEITADGEVLLNGSNLAGLFDGFE